MIENIIHQLPLPLLTQVGSNYNFRCVVCGDSKKSETKKRGWILIDGTKATYHCFNCSYSKSILQFLKEHYPDVHKQYIKILFKDKGHRRDKIVQTEIEDTSQSQQSVLKLQKLNQLPEDHIGVQYFKQRQIPTKFLRYLYWSDNFCEYVNTVLPDKIKNVPDTDPRMIIPFYTVHKKIFAVQGRSLKKTGLRYITIKFDEGHKKVFGIERMCPYKTILITEGPIDSLFLPNSIAIGGADLDLNYLEGLAKKEKYIFCFDNEPRNKEMCNRIEKVLRAGFRACLLPHNMKKYGKDINDFIMAGMTSREICAIIKANIVQGKMGLVKFKLWKQC